MRSQEGVVGILAASEPAAEGPAPRISPGGALSALKTIA